MVLLGLYNGQKLEHEPEEDMVTYSRALKVLCAQLPAPQAKTPVSRPDTMCTEDRKLPAQQMCVFAHHLSNT